MTTQAITLLWFRQDLRLSDNPALQEAINAGNILPIYIFDTVNADPPLGGASRVWLYHSLTKLNNALQQKLQFFVGDATDIIKQLTDTLSISAIYWNRCYEPWRIQRDKLIKETLKQQNIPVESFNGSLLWEPWQIKDKHGNPFRVFTPYYRKGCLNQAGPRKPLEKPTDIPLVTLDEIQTQLQTQLPTHELSTLLTGRPWETSIVDDWQIGEEAAQEKCQQFLSHTINSYKSGRNFPAKQQVSRLSPHLRFGEISPNQVWYATQYCPQDKNTQHFCSELAWREFSYYLLYHHPDLPKQNMYSQFDDFPWQNNPELLKAWQQGKTGFPFIDAGMRELYQTGYMHNRLRMCVGAFLTKNAFIDWRQGEKWFWDCLFDADLASNSASWQWVAGSGTDTKEYLRLFNPITQGKKFDPHGDYIRRFVPELAQLDDAYLHAPWEAPDEVLAQAGICLGENYPHPMLNYHETATAAQAAFAKMSFK